MQGRELITFQIPGTSLWGIKFSGGGHTPHTLQGSYTTEGLALQAIERYKEIASAGK
jgi:hypothetical protein